MLLLVCHRASFRWHGWDHEGHVSFCDAAPCSSWRARSLGWRLALRAGSSTLATSIESFLWDFSCGVGHGVTEASWRDSTSALLRWSGMGGMRGPA